MTNPRRRKLANVKRGKRATQSTSLLTSSEPFRIFINSGVLTDIPAKIDSLHFS